MGVSLPGYRAVILDKEEVKEVGPGIDGEISIDIDNSPLHWFKGYWGKETKRLVTSESGKRYDRCGDVASSDKDGFLYYSGRNDDVITSSGYRIGPFEIESELMVHPSVAECAVIGVPDPEGLRGEIVKAFIVLKKGYTGDASLEEQLKLMVKKRLAAHMYPRQFAFIAELPKTPSGKVQRFLLKK